MADTVRLSGSLESDRRNIIRGTLHSSKVLTGGVSRASCKRYVGEYDVIPSFETQTLKTDYKHMDSDVTVHPIPYQEFENEAGGLTVIIG